MSIFYHFVLIPIWSRKNPLATLSDLIVTPGYLKGGLSNLTRHPICPLDTQNDLPGIPTDTLKAPCYPKKSWALYCPSWIPPMDLMDTLGDLKGSLDNFMGTLWDLMGILYGGLKFTLKALNYFRRALSNLMLPSSDLMLPSSKLTWSWASGGNLRLFPTR